MRKNNFISGTFLMTLCIIITKVIGAIYVIPFYAIIGTQGGALYGYAYTVYLFFMSLSTSGIPLAISKIVSEYQALGHIKAKERAFSISRRIAFIFSVICFIIIMLCAPLIASGVVGGVKGASSIRDVTLVIRVIGIAILIVPILSIYRGYFEGHRYMEAPSYSQVIEQLVRVSIIVFGSFLTVKVFKGGIVVSVSVALMGASIGALISYLYLVYKLHKNSSRFNRRLIKTNEPIVRDKVIIKKIFTYSIPFIMIDVFKSMYNYIDMFQTVKGLVSVGFSAKAGEEVYSILSTWGNKFNMIVLAISSGIIINLIPNLSDSIINNKDNSSYDIITKSFNILMFLGIPLTLGISFLSIPIWSLFYGKSLYGPSVLSYYIFVGLVTALSTIGIVILLCYKDYKGMFISLSVGILIKLMFNKSLIGIFNGLGSPGYYGIITATIIGYLSTFIISMIIISIKYRYHLDKIFKCFVDIIIGGIIMIFILYLLKFIVPIRVGDRLRNILIILLYGIVGMIVYFYYSYRVKLFDNVFGKNWFKRIKKSI